MIDIGGLSDVEYEFALKNALESRDTISYFNLCNFYDRPAEDEHLYLQGFRDYEEEYSVEYAQMCDSVRFGIYNYPLGVSKSMLGIVDESHLNTLYHGMIHLLFSEGFVASSKILNSDVITYSYIIGESLQGNEVYSDRLISEFTYFSSYISFRDEMRKLMSIRGPDFMKYFGRGIDDYLDVMSTGRPKTKDIFIKNFIDQYLELSEERIPITILPKKDIIEKLFNKMQSIGLKFNHNHYYYYL
jgi:hypothetical protein